MSSPYRAVLFDLFGTLVDNFDAADYRVMLHGLAAVLHVPQADFRRLWRESFNDRSIGVLPNPQASFEYICRELGIPVTDEQLDKATEARLAFTARMLRPRPQSVPTLLALREKGVKTGLISDCTGEVPLQWPKTEFEGLFEVTIFSCTAGVKKPDPRIYLMATNALGVRPEECVYVGDGSSNELTGARNLGMRAVLIRDPDEQWDELFNQREDDWTGERIARASELLPLLGLEMERE